MKNKHMFISAENADTITDDLIQVLLENLVNFKRRFHIVMGCHGLSDGSTYFWKTPESRTNEIHEGFRDLAGTVLST